MILESFDQSRDTNTLSWDFETNRKQKEHNKGYNSAGVKGAKAGEKCSIFEWNVDKERLCGALCWQHDGVEGTGGIMPLNMLRGETVCLCVAWCALCWQQGEGTGHGTCCLDRANTQTTREHRKRL